MTYRCKYAELDTKQNHWHLAAWETTNTHQEKVRKGCD